MWKLIIVVILLVSCAPKIKQDVDTYMTGYCDGWNAREHQDNRAQIIIDSLKTCLKSAQK